MQSHPSSQQNDNDIIEFKNSIVDRLKKIGYVEFYVEKYKGAQYAPGIIGGFGGEPAGGFREPDGILRTLWRDYKKSSHQNTAIYKAFEPFFEEICHISGNRLMGIQNHSGHVLTRLAGPRGTR